MGDLKDFFETEDQENYKAFKKLGFNDKLETFLIVVARCNAVQQLEDKLKEYVEQKKLCEHYSERQIEEIQNARQRRV